MCEQQKVIFYAAGLPIPRSLAVMLLLNDNFFELKPCKFEKPHSLKRKRLHHSLFSGIAHEYCTEFVLFENPETLLSHLAHFRKKWFYGEQ